MELIRYTFYRELTEKFGDLCNLLYCHEPFWSQGFRQRVLDQFDPKFDFYLQPGNVHCHILAIDNGKPVGHISAIINANLQAKHGQHLGLIGFFECVDDSALAAALLNEARSWLGSQHGITSVIGPMNFDIWRGYRFMTKGFDKAHFLGEPYNKDYYPGFFEKNGFSVCKRWITVLIEGTEILQGLIDPWRPHYLDALLDGYRFLPIDPENTGQIMQLQHTIEDSFRHFLYFKTLDHSEFKAVFGAYLTSLDLRFVSLVWTKEERPAGFVIAFPGETPDAPAILFMLGITQEEAARHKGMGRAAIYHCLHQLIEAGWHSVRFVLIAENSPARHLLGAYADCAEKEYAIYESQL
jgi:hypothetical protein